MGLGLPTGKGEALGFVTSPGLVAGGGAGEERGAAVPFTGVETTGAFEVFGTAVGRGPERAGLVAVGTLIGSLISTRPPATLGGKLMLKGAEAAPLILAAKELRLSSPVTL